MHSIALLPEFGWSLARGCASARELQAVDTRRALASDLAGLDAATVNNLGVALVAQTHVRGRFGAARRCFKLASALDPGDETPPLNMRVLAELRAESVTWPDVEPFFPSAMCALPNWGEAKFAGPAGLDATSAHAPTRYWLGWMCVHAAPHAKPLNRPDASAIRAAQSHYRAAAARGCAPARCELGLLLCEPVLSDTAGPRALAAPEARPILTAAADAGDPVACMVCADLYTDAPDKVLAWVRRAVQFDPAARAPQLALAWRLARDRPPAGESPVDALARSEAVWAALAVAERPTAADYAHVYGDATGSCILGRDGRVALQLTRGRDWISRAADADTPCSADVDDGVLFAACELARPATRPVRTVALEFRVGALARFVHAWPLGPASRVQSLHLDPMCDGGARGKAVSAEDDAVATALLARLRATPTLHTLSVEWAPLVPRLATLVRANQLVQLTVNADTAIRLADHSADALFLAVAESKRLVVFEWAHSVKLRLPPTNGHADGPKTQAPSLVRLRLGYGELPVADCARWVSTMPTLRALIIKDTSSYVDEDASARAYAHAHITRMLPSLPHLVELELTDTTMDGDAFRDLLRSMRAHRTLERLRLGVAPATAIASTPAFDAPEAHELAGVLAMPSSNLRDLTIGSMTSNGALVLALAVASPSCRLARLSVPLYAQAAVAQCMSIRQSQSLQVVRFVHKFSDDKYVPLVESALRLLAEHPSPLLVYLAIPAAPGGARRTWRTPSTLMVTDGYTPSDATVRRAHARHHAGWAAASFLLACARDCPPALAPSAHGLLADLARHACTSLFGIESFTRPSELTAPSALPTTLYGRRAAQVAVRRDPPDRTARV